LTVDARKGNLHSVTEIQPDGFDPSPLATVTIAQDRSRGAEEALRDAVERARAAGHTWQEIGDVLGTTRQAAFQRFGRPIDPRTGKPMPAALPDAAERAITLLGEIADGHWDDIRRDFDETMTEKLSADRIAEVWTMLAGLVGAFETFGTPTITAAGDYTVVRVPLHFEAGEIRGEVTYNRDYRVAGLFFRPPEAS
jgi:hypothetical protein